jgi:hypothetical protein
MTQCWTEGELRAYLDRELPPGDMARVATHLKECAVCSAVHDDLEGRAARVSALFEALPELQAVLRIPNLARRSRWNWRWAAGLALAAIVIILLTMPKPRPRPERMVIAPLPRAPLPQAPAAPTQQPVQVRPAIIRRKLPAKPKPQLQYYVALDNEPIETGIVVRVGLDGGQIPADVIFGPDGRAHAFRLVSDSTGER